MRFCSHQIALIFKIFQAEHGTPKWSGLGASKRSQHSQNRC